MCREASSTATASRWHEDRFAGCEAAMRWLEQQVTPSIHACVGVSADTPYRLYVPDNAGDKVAASWVRGNEGSIADYRTEKDIRPTNLHGDHAVNYVWTLAEGHSQKIEALIAATRSITHLGWGVDLVVGDAAILSSDEIATLAGERWQPVIGDDGTGLRVPINGTLDALVQKHQSFLNRIGPDGFRPVPPLTTFHVVSYRRATDPIRQPWAAFSILKLDGSGFRPFDVLRRTREVSGMVRHLLSVTAKNQGWSDEDINQFIHGKSPNGQRLANGSVSPDRFHYLPLPTINTKLNRIESVRRILITAPAGCEKKVDGRSKCWLAGY